MDKCASCSWPIKEQTLNFTPYDINAVPVCKKCYWKLTLSSLPINATLIGLILAPTFVMFSIFAGVFL